MKIGGIPIYGVVNIFIWLILLGCESTIGLQEGLASFYLPVSLVFLLISQLRQKRSEFDLSTLFLVSCFFFFCIGLVLWPFSSISPTEFSSLVITTFSWRQLDFAAICIGLSIAITMATVMRLQIRNKLHSELRAMNFSELDSIHCASIYKFGASLIAIALPMVLIESIEQLQFIRSAGYLALYTDGVPVSVMSKVFFYIFYLGFGLVLAFANSKKQFLIPALLYLFIATVDSLKGARGALLVPLLFVVWFYVGRFDVRVRVIAVLRNLTVVFLAFSLLTFQRTPELLSGGLLQFGVDALITQGRSLQTTALYQTVADEVGQYGNYMVLSNLFIPFIAVIHPEIREAAQSMDQVLYSNNLKHILTYVLNDSYYFSGGGTGGVYTIELIESGPFFYVLLSIMLGWFLAWMPTAMGKPWMRYLSIYFFSTIFYLPRGELLFNTLIVGKAALMYLAVVYIFSIFKRKKNNVKLVRDNVCDEVGC
jgi:hypothetical protein